MVKGMLIDTEDETNSRPIAISNDFCSGLARDTIFRNEDAVGGVFMNDPGRIFDNIDFTGKVENGRGFSSLEG